MEPYGGFNLLTASLKYRGGKSWASYICSSQIGQESASKAMNNRVSLSGLFAMSAISHRIAPVENSLVEMVNQSFGHAKNVDRRVFIRDYADRL